MQAEIQYHHHCLLEAACLEPTPQRWSHPQYYHHCLLEAACLEPTPQRWSHPFLRTHSLGWRSLNLFGNFALANIIQIVASNFIHGSNPVSRMSYVTKADSEVKEMDENVFIGSRDTCKYFWNSYFACCSYSHERCEEIKIGYSRYKIMPAGVRKRHIAFSGTSSARCKGFSLASVSVSIF
jgi:hypothetical protein